MHVFDITARSYDKARSRLIPCFEDFYQTAVALIPADADNVLDLGAGTGLLSAFVRERFPRAHLHLIDSSEPMLVQARERFKHDQKATFQLADYTESVAQRNYDAVVSALSIHHLLDEAKQRLFRDIHAALKPGGVFVNAEQILAPTQELEAQARVEWLTEVRTRGATEAQIEASWLRQAEDRCATVSSQLKWMSDAGFKDVACAFEQGRFAVLFGTRDHAG